MHDLRVNKGQLATFAVRILVPVLALLAGMIGLGLLITKVWEHHWPFTVEDAVNRGFAAHRTSFWNGVTWFFSQVGSTPVIIGVTIVCAIVLLKRVHGWREPLYLCACVTAQAIVFFFATLAIDRQRPAVHRLDNSPPTSSFPSGHTSASVALYGGLAFVLAGLVRRTYVKWICWSLILVPVAVATSRMYRGMHHPSDVTASFINGTLCIVIMAAAILNRDVRWRRSEAGQVRVATPSVS